jgi:hypothetical protein
VNGKIGNSVLLVILEFRSVSSSSGDGDPVFQIVLDLLQPLLSLPKLLCSDLCRSLRASGALAALLLAWRASYSEALRLLPLDLSGFLLGALTAFFEP